MTTAVHDPLRAPEPDGTHWVPPLDIALEAARETLAEQQRANIYDDRAMLTAAVRLEIALRHLLAALDAEAAR
ncbi:hypothetical protein [Streptomyces antarcticus]|uniref:hypothetical protein n=1 Tax=Streptomyces antarcticus TaxID=2996458 RepID=UPI00226D7B50|nr:MULTISPECIES: hypothetical protein [unclassified Streptomyces]MCY0943558.1 hypothetical protein [Streptomyces sp. H34-AA3]MCZ4083533.1 hypothetical protein [Streptomyces sp. H34-S5]